MAGSRAAHGAQTVGSQRLGYAHVALVLWASWPRSARAGETDVTDVTDVMAQIERARARARAEAGEHHARTLNLYTPTCERLYADGHVQLPCARPMPPPKPSWVRVDGRREWSREGRCYDPFYPHAQSEIKTDGTLVYVTVHAAATRAHATLLHANGSVAHRLKLKYMRSCNPQSMFGGARNTYDDLAARKTRERRLAVTSRARAVVAGGAGRGAARKHVAFTAVREPIARFVLGYNTVLDATDATTITKLQHRALSRWPSGPRACAAKEAVLSHFVSGMMAPEAARRAGGNSTVAGSARDGVPFAALRYDLHTATQAHELGCAFRPDPGSGRLRQDRPRYVRLREVRQLEAPRRRRVAGLPLLGGRAPELHELYPGALPDTWMSRLSDAAEGDGGTGGVDACRVTRATLAEAGVLRQLCEYYAQDYVCFDYPLPPECAPRGSTERRDDRR